MAERMKMRSPRAKLIRRIRLRADRNPQPPYIYPAQGVEMKPFEAVVFAFCS